MNKLPVCKKKERLLQKKQWICVLYRLPICKFRKHKQYFPILRGIFLNIVPLPNDLLGWSSDGIVKPRSFLLSSECRVVDARNSTSSSLTSGVSVFFIVFFEALFVGLTFSFASLSPRRRELLFDFVDDILMIKLHNAKHMKRTHGEGRLLSVHISQWSCFQCLWFFKGRREGEGWNKQSELLV